MQTRRAAPETPVRRGAAPAEDARLRLLHAGLRLFAQQGYARSSTRELAEAASVNVAAISYYFGDKAGLYRAVFFGPRGSSVEADLARFSGPGLTLDQVLRGFFEVFISPLREGDTMRLCMKLRFREMLEPTGLWEEEVAQGIKPLHDQMAAVLARHLGLARPDLELVRLVACLAGLGVHLHVGHDIHRQLAPGLNAGPQALEHWADALVRYGHALLQAEAARRGVVLQTTAAP
ncbi:MAG: CerR family C-terminal domain-containing protein [Rubrivivax sp.]|nr:CerR family C-terminal domain-containing protein [Rubrivivax sp.]